MKNRLPYKTFDLFASYDADVPFVERVYKWITSVGRYIVIGVEMVVLSAFIARFILDQNLNDLTDKINDNNAVLERMRPDEKRFRDIQNKVTAIKNINNLYQDKLAKEIPKLYSFSAQGIKVISVDYSNMVVDSLPTESMLVTVSSATKQAPEFEKFLSENILNPDKVLPNPNIISKLLNVSNSATDTSGFTYTFKIVRTS